MMHSALGEQGFRDLYGDVQVVLFPTIARRSADGGQWHVPIHGWIFRPRERTRRRAAALALFRRFLSMRLTGAEREVFDERIRAFLVNNQAHQALVVQLNQRPYGATQSAANGHIHYEIQVPAEAARAAMRGRNGGSANGDRWLHYQAVLPQRAEQAFAGMSQLLDARGVSVISDIDDTIKVSHVRRRRTLLRQTFLRDFEPVPGMARLYEGWRARGASFHYVSRSPWQLYQPLAEFLTLRGFPRGTFHMRHLRWRAGRAFRSDRRGKLKRRAIEALVEGFAERRFILVGDSGEGDPEIYADVARRFPSQVSRIFIRNTTRDLPRGERFVRAFAGIEPGVWQVFDDARELPAVL